MTTIPPSDLGKAVFGKKILVDTNIIIYLTDRVQPYEPLSRILFEMIEKGEVYCVVSIISIAEIMQGPLKKGFNKRALSVRDYLLNFPNIFCQDITIDVLDQIGEETRIKWSRLRTVDSLIIASGLKNRVNQFISNDRHFTDALPQEFVTSFDKS